MRECCCGSGCSSSSSVRLAAIVSAALIAAASCDRCRFGVGGMMVWVLLLHNHFTTIAFKFAVWRSMTSSSSGSRCSVASAMPSPQLIVSSDRSDI